MGGKKARACLLPRVFARLLRRLRCCWRWWMDQLLGLQRRRSHRRRRLARLSAGVYETRRVLVVVRRTAGGGGERRCQRVSSVERMDAERREGDSPSCRFSSVGGGLRGRRTMQEASGVEEG